MVRMKRRECRARLVAAQSRDTLDTLGTLIIDAGLHPEAYIYILCNMTVLALDEHWTIVRHIRHSRQKIKGRLIFINDVQDASEICSPHSHINVDLTQSKS